MIPEGNPKDDGCRGKGCPLHGESNGGSAFLWVLISDIKQSSSVACGPGHLDFSHSNIRCDAPGHLDFSRGRGDRKDDRTRWPAPPVGPRENPRPARPVDPRENACPFRRSPGKCRRQGDRKDDRTRWPSFRSPPPEDGATERTAARGGMDSPRATERMPAQMVRAPLPPSPGSDAGSRVARNSTQVDETPHGLPGHNLE